MQLTAESSFSDNSAVNRKETSLQKDVGDLAASKGYELSLEQRGLLMLPNTNDARICYRWMYTYFYSFGDRVPNSDRIHLDHAEAKSVWEDYMDDATIENNLSYARFLQLWKMCFPYVRLREYKQCCAKCEICFKLSEARRGTKDKEKKTFFTNLHALHRSMYMAERIKYGERRYLAQTVPRLHLSTISDGMAQLHCLLPYYANKFTVSASDFILLRAVYHVVHYR